MPRARNTRPGPSLFYKPAPDEAKVWFQSLETLAKVLSENDRELHATIADTNPGSLDELAAKTRRAVCPISRVPSGPWSYGVVHFEQGPHRRLAPGVDYSAVELAVSF
ncbi:HVO_A0114 family putative DNA-binding protein [Caballeronia arvi]